MRPRKLQWLGLAAFAVALGGHATLAIADECDGSPVAPERRAHCRKQLESAFAQASQEEEAAPRVAAAGTAGPREKAAARMAAIAANYKAYAVALDEVYQASHCERALTVCYDRDGELIRHSPAETLPASVRVGDKVTVMVLSQEQGDDLAIAVSFESRKSLDRLFADAGSAAEQRVRATSELRSYTALPFVSDPVSEDAEELTITFQRKPSGDAPGIDSQRSIAVDRGHSYYSVALLVAATFKADRRVLRNLTTSSDHAVDPGLALNIFPFGRQRGVIGYLRTCRWTNIRRCLANNLGLQIGTDLDLSNPTDKLYFGAVFEPVAGLALVGGVSLRKVDVVPPAGALPALAAMDGASPTDSRYVARGYVGVTITLDLLETISATGSKIRSVKTP